MMMTRSKKPAVQAEEVQKKTRTEIEDDFINYGLENFLYMAKAQNKLQPQ